jgi:Flp pilus assembly protein TadD
MSLRSHQYDKALAAVLRLESQYPDNPMVHNLKGGVLLMKRNTTGARASFERALQLDPLFLPAMDNLTTMDINTKNLSRHASARKRRWPRIKVTRISCWRSPVWLQRRDGQTSSRTGWSAPRKPNRRRWNPRSDWCSSMRGAMIAPRRSCWDKKLLTSYPWHAQLLTLVASLQSRSGQTEAALDSWTKLASLQPESPDTLLQLAAARDAVHDRDGAREAFAQGGRFIHQGVRSAAISGHGASAVQCAHSGRRLRQPPSIEKWLASHAGDHASRLYYASSLLAMKDYPASTTQFEQVLKQVPGHAVALNNLAWLYQQQRDPRALAYAEQAYKLAPDNPAMSDTLAWLLVEQGRLDRALPLLKQAVAKAPTSAELRFHYGVALSKSGDQRAAREQLEPLLAIKNFDHRDAVKALLAQ